VARVEVGRDRVGVDLARLVLLELRLEQAHLARELAPEGLAAAHVLAGERERAAVRLERRLQLAERLLLDLVELDLVGHVALDLGARVLGAADAAALAARREQRLRLLEVGLELLDARLALMRLGVEVLHLDLLADRAFLQASHLALEVADARLDRAELGAHALDLADLVLDRLLALPGPGD